MQDRRPPVIVLGAEEPTAGLVAVRELGERGVPVHAIFRSRAPAFYSRWLTRGYMRPADSDGTVALINAIAERLGPAFLIGITEIDLRILRAADDEGRLRGLRLLAPTAAQLRIANDKARTYALAAELGIPVPRSWHPSRVEGAADPPDELGYPCVLKWIDPVGVAPLLELHRIKLRKVEYCADRNALREALLRYEPVGIYPLVQEYCPGVAHAYCLFMHRGRPLLRFRHYRPSEWPIGIAARAVSQALDASDALMEKSAELLAHLGWEGAAMFEYRHDPVSKRTVLLDLNGRFWTGQALAYHSGAPFVWLTYAVLGLGEPVAVAPYRAGVACMGAVSELSRLSALLFRPSALREPGKRYKFHTELARFVFALCDPRTRYYVFSWRDPMPFVADTVLKAMRAGAALLHLHRRGARRS